MSGSELLPFVAEVLRDKSAAEAAEEIKALREELKAERESRRKIEIVAEDGTVVAVGTLEGIEPKRNDHIIVDDGYIREVASVCVPVTMVATCKSLDFFKIRIGGIEARKLNSTLSRSRLVVRENETNEEQDDSYYNLSLKWPYMHADQRVVSDATIYQHEVDGNKLILKGVSFTCSPRIPGRDATGDRFNFVLAEDEIDEVVFKGITFSTVVEGEAEESSFLSVIRQYAAETQANA